MIKLTNLKLSRRLLFILVVLVLISGGGYWWWQKEGVYLIRRKVVFVSPPQAMKNPSVIEDASQFRLGVPYKLGQNEASTILAKVQKVSSHPKNADEYLLYLDLMGENSEIEEVPFVIKPIYTPGEKETPGRETYIYRSQTDENGNQFQLTADISDLEAGITVFVTYRINQNEEVFAVTIGIQGFLY